jgi:hypothetical protein
MKSCLKTLALALIAVSTYSLSGCSAPAGFSYQNVSVSFTTFCSDCPGPYFNPAYPQPPNPGSVVMMPNTGEGGTETFVASVTNAPATNVTWTLYPTPNLGDIDTPPSATTPPGQSGGPAETGNPLGTINVASGNTIYYTVPGPPVYSGAALVQAQAMGIPQGDVLLVASVPNDPGNPSSVATGNQLIQVYGGSSAQGPPSSYLTPHSQTTPAGQTQPVVTVTHNTSYAFYGGIVGAAPCTTTTACNAIAANTPLYTADNVAVWAVGPANESLTTAVVGGNATYGKITQQGVYTAPATVPSTTNSSTAINGEVVVYVWSQLAPTVASYAYVGIN